MVSGFRVLEDKWVGAVTFREMMEPVVRRRISV